MLFDSCVFFVACKIAQIKLIKDPVSVHKSGTSAVIEQSSSHKSDEIVSEATFDVGRCMARVWGGGKGGQCKKVKPSNCDFCGTHAPIQAHGRIDGPIPANKARMMTSEAIPKAVLKTKESHRAAGAGVDVAKRIDSSNEYAHALKAWRHRRKGKRGDEGMRRSILARMNEDMSFDKDMEQATADSLRLCSVQQKQREAAMALITNRLAVFGLCRQPTPADGNCQFISMARLLGFPDDSAAELRQEICKYLDRHVEEFREFQADGRWQGM